MRLRRTSMRSAIIGIIAGVLLAGSLSAADETHECYYHPYYFNETLGDLLNIYGCVYGDLSRYFNIYEALRLGGGIPIRVLVAPFYAITGELLDDVQIVWYPVGGGNALAYSPVVITSASSPGPVILNWTPPVGGEYRLVVSTTSNQRWDYSTGRLGFYNILITNAVVATPTQGPPIGTPTPERGRQTATPGAPPATPKPTPTPTPDLDARRPRIVPFR